MFEDLLRIFARIKLQSESRDVQVAGAQAERSVQRAGEGCRHPAPRWVYQRYSSMHDPRCQHHVWLVSGGGPSSGMHINASERKKKDHLR